MKAYLLYLIFLLAFGLLVAANKLHLGRRMALSVCLLIMGIGCGGAAGKPDVTAVQKELAGTKDPMSLGKVWQDFARLAVEVDQTVGKGKWDKNTYNRLSSEYQLAVNNVNAVLAPERRLEKNAFGLLSGMYSLLLFDWMASNQMITCYSPRMAPTDPVEIAREKLNGRLINIHSDYVSGKLSYEAYKTALLGLADEQKDMLDAQTIAKLKELMSDSVAKP
jgi:hypothetical protein